MTKFYDNCSTNDSDAMHNKLQQQIEELTSSAANQETLREILSQMQEDREVVIKRMELCASLVKKNKAKIWMSGTSQLIGSLFFIRYRLGSESPLKTDIAWYKDCLPFPYFTRNLTFTKKTLVYRLLPFLMSFAIIMLSQKALQKTLHSSFSLRKNLASAIETSETFNFLVDLVDATFAKLATSSASLTKTLEPQAQEDIKSLVNLKRPTKINTFVDTSVFNLFQSKIIPPKQVQQEHSDQTTSSLSIAP